MCYFITVAVPADKARFLEKHVPRGLHIDAIANACLLEQVGSGYRTYLLTSGGCSCGLYGQPRDETAAGAESEDQAEQERRRLRYEKMGWSASKIDRALRQHLARRVEAPLVGLRDDIQRFFGEIAAKVGQLALVVHWYDKDVQFERFTCTEGETASADAALAGRVPLNVDEILRIKGTEKS